VVENQPDNLEWATIVKPIQAWWFSQWLATLALIVWKWSGGWPIQTFFSNQFLQRFDFAFCVL